MNMAGTTNAAKTLKSIREAVAGDSPVLAAAMAAGTGDDSGSGFSDLFSGATSGGLEGAEDYSLALEYIFEGYLLHYGVSRIFKASAGEFSLLAGDYMYARGLDHVTARGDLASVALLAELIEFCAIVHCEQLPPELAADAWALTVLRIAAVVEGAADIGERRLPRRIEDVDAARGEMESILEPLLSSHPEETAAGLRDELCNIYSSFNQLRRRDGTG